MTQSVYGRRGIAVAPHSLAAESAVAVLREGGNALEAMIAAAATIAVVYPHMNSIGGDGFWVINGPGNRPGGIDASGRSAASASREAYAARGVKDSIPFRGGMAALTVAGTLSGWGAAHRLSSQSLGGRLPLSRLLDDAIFLARGGIPVTRSQANITQAKLSELKDQPGFAQTFLANGAVPQAGALFRQGRLADTLALIARKGTDEFYRGTLARQMAAELAAVGSPLTLADLQAHQAKLVDPLTVPVAGARLHNMVPPSQGLVSLLILALMERFLGWKQADPESAAFVHAQVEATKLAFRVRDRYLTDPDFMVLPPAALLESARIDALAREFKPDAALPWGRKAEPGDTIWMGVIDKDGIAVSFIQSIYHEFGAGVVLPTSGVNWQNRGCSFSLNPGHVNTLEPRKKPFHTLNAGLAQINDGGSMVYGAMGGDGQPQTQATIFNRVMRHGDHPQLAIERPRWLLGRTWGQSSDTLKLESRFDPAVLTELRALGHEVETIGAWDEGVGHAGMLIRHANGVLEGGFDPRSNGAVASF
ncbi:MAG: gamma-glutamyltransferase family protein [Curvibacter sp.]|jgi:gamma-glutamyltranspeptidase/glutathione hydrolase|nr:gamma-glutamyltransferase family protein [Curvibacter sp.]